MWRIRQAPFQGMAQFLRHCTRYPPRRLLDEYKRFHDVGDIDASNTKDGEGSIAEDTLAGSMEGLNLSDSGHLGTNPSKPDASHNAVPQSLQDAYEMVKEFYSQESYRHEVYISACCIGPALVDQ
jgi:hypothetical protein